MNQIDEVAHVLLKGHLLIEEALTRIIEKFTYHPQHLTEANLRFFQKVQIARALCLRKDQFGEWELILAINSLRNEVAHKLQSPNRDKKFDRVKEVYFREVAGFPEAAERRNASDATILMFACGHCTGFLGTYEEDAKSFRKMVHSMDRVMNPDQPPFDL